jgi:hypothetical protein
MSFDIHWSENAAWSICLSTMFLAIMGAVGAVAWGSAEKTTACHKAQAAAFASSNPEAMTKVPLCP